MSNFLLFSITYVRYLMKMRCMWFMCFWISFGGILRFSSVLIMNGPSYSRGNNDKGFNYSAF